MIISSAQISSIKTMILNADKILKKFKFETLCPALLILCTQIIAAANVYFTFIIYLTFPVALSSLYYYFSRKSPRTKFFCFWFCYSALYLLIIFECFVPLLELLPQENFAFISLTAMSLFCFVKTYHKSQLNLLNANVDCCQDDDATVNLIMSDRDDSETETNSNTCQICRKHIPLRAQHCVICRTCILRQDHHSYLLNCCIGRFNHKYYLFGLFTSLITLIFFANLCLTAICHPFELFDLFGILILMPDDCSDVYGDFEYALCFVGSIYALVLAAVIAAALFQQVYLISKGLTIAEYRKGDRERNTHVTCFRNWRNFLFC